MAAARKTPVNRFGKRLRQKRMVRVEIHVQTHDVLLVKSVARALGNPKMAAAARAILKARFTRPAQAGLKALLASAPLEDVDLERPRGMGHDMGRFMGRFMGREIDPWHGPQDRSVKHPVDRNVMSKIRKIASDASDATGDHDQAVAPAAAAAAIAVAAAARGNTARPCLASHDVS